MSKINSSGLAFCAVVKDSTSNIRRMITSLSKLNLREIVIVDTGCDKKTVEYLKSVATKYIFRKWNNDFANQRNYAIKSSQSEWIFTLDSDEAASGGLVKSIPKLISVKNVDGYKIPRVHYAGEGESLNDYWRQLRLYRREAKYVGAVHESIKNLNNVETIDDFTQAILHYNKRADQRNKSLQYSKWLKDKIAEAKLKGRRHSLIYYQYKLWVQDNVYWPETDSNVSKVELREKYKEYEKRKKVIEGRIDKENWKII